MPHAPRSPTNCAGMQTKLSAWTPLNHPLTNSKLFEERRTLLKKWFDRWSDSQRRAVLQDFVLSCSQEQLKFLSVSVSRQLPLQAADFTCQLPRALCLYIFSFLDPRSLCRCAQVSWHWKSIVELDQLWMPKCLRLGWCISFSLTPFEQGAWKRHYIQSVQELRLTRLQTAPSPQQFVIPEATANNSRHEDLAEVALVTEERPVSTVHPAGSSLRFGLSKDKQPTTLPPWRDSDRRPKDTLRFNYLDNLEPVQQALRGQMNITATTCRGNTSVSVDGRRKSLSEATYKLRKAKSLMFLSSGCRPQHPPPPPPSPPPPPHQAKTQLRQASCGVNHPIIKETTRSLLSLAQWNAGVRPGPVRSAVPRLSAAALRASQRSHRSSPSAPLFEVPSWIWPASQAR
ncbi:F-box only protein 16 [Hippoglossus stenolepis]|uniref:F-box only protein 16 n=1 Tax=Hippoglossus stenolepis TaxID=195615 RepID=UPI001FAF87C3|nr:F-box only protein 16 [Hippoglossus stenolepis]